MFSAGDKVRCIEPDNGGFGIPPVLIKDNVYTVFAYNEKIDAIMLKEDMPYFWYVYRFEKI